MEDIETEIEALRGSSRLRRIGAFLKDAGKIRDMKQRLDEVLNLFKVSAGSSFKVHTGADSRTCLQLKAAINTEIGVAELLNTVNEKLVDKRMLVCSVALDATHVLSVTRTGEHIINKIEETQVQVEREGERTRNELGQKAVLSNLPYADGAGWRKEKGCIEGTREAFLNEIFDRMTTKDDGPIRIYCLENLAGIGKTAIAHSFAKRCYDKGILGSSFFFDRENRERSRLLFVTIARDLAARDDRIHAHISAAIEREPGLASRGLSSHQFTKLILEPCQRYHPKSVTIIVIDALDESFNEDVGQAEALFQILHDEVPKLPPCIRIFVTSRDTRYLRPLKQVPHFHSLYLDIRGESNLNDIKTYAHHALGRIASVNGYDSDWPGQELTEELMKKAEGLFVWITTVTSSLSTISYPGKKLQALLSVTKEAQSGLRAEEKMDALYSTVLGTCDWTDEDFVDGYRSFVGSLLASKVPLSASAIQSLLQLTNPDFRINEIASRVSSLLSGWPEKGVAIQILHQSLRDFVTERAQLRPEWQRFSINEREHSSRLAPCCLLMLVKNLRPDIPCAGFIGGRKGVPAMREDAVSEELWYACRFGMDHVVDVDAPDAKIAELLREFLSTKVVLWMEVVASKGCFLSLTGVRKWIKVGRTNVMSE